MFILNPKKFADNTIESLDTFVSYWSRFYKAPKSVNYLEELNFNEDLTKENIKELLRWKSARHLSYENEDGEKNLKVQKSIEGIETINKFRNKKIAEHKFLDFITQNIFSNGPVYSAFLFHIARPDEYPIWDQNVARVHICLTNEEIIVGKINVNWEHYEKYRTWFSELKAALKIKDGFSKENMEKTKRLDDALMSFGQFLKKYSVGEIGRS